MTWNCFSTQTWDGTHYVQLAINALNTQMDVLKTEIDNKPFFPNWDSGTESAVVVAGSLEDGADRDESWTVELFLSLEQYGPRGTGTKPVLQGERKQMCWAAYRFRRRSGTGGRPTSIALITVGARSDALISVGGRYATKKEI